MPRKLKGGTLRDFSKSILLQISKKIEGGPFGKKLSRKKVSQCRKQNWKGDPLVSPGMVWYAGKQEEPFWFSSLDQLVQFGAIISCRTFKNYFGQFVWIEKNSHYNSRVSLHEAVAKNFACDDNYYTIVHDRETTLSRKNSASIKSTVVKLYCELSTL